jgi:hydroxymethylglutaryl-CoA reductase
MKIVASAGLANNFSAVRALVTGGIQKGHMQLHLGNILFQLNADETERKHAMAHFGDKTVSFRSVADYLHALRKKQ